mmetsp:Transcript_7473/g.14168  ORF Transcript_7473/g.14168 Transcript_7473/m.14168 type:complete len:109 (+) Transcript_7473:129-455(+)
MEWEPVAMEAAALVGTTVGEAGTQAARALAVEAMQAMRAVTLEVVEVVGLASSAVVQVIGQEIVQEVDNLGRVWEDLEAPVVGVGRVTSAEATVIGLEIVWLAELRRK